MNLRNIFIVSVCIMSSVLAMEQIPLAVSSYGEDYWKIVFGIDDSDAIKEAKIVLHSKMHDIITFRREETRKLYDPVPGENNFLQKLLKIDDFTSGIRLDESTKPQLVNKIIQWLCVDLNFVSFEVQDFARLFLATEIAKTQSYNELKDLNYMENQTFLENDNAKKIFVLSRIQNEMYSCFHRGKSKLTYAIGDDDELLKKVCSTMLKDTMKKKLHAIVVKGYSVLENLGDKIVDFDCVEQSKERNLALLQFSEEIELEKPVQKQTMSPFKKLLYGSLGIGAFSLFTYFAVKSGWLKR